MRKLFNCTDFVEHWKISESLKELQKRKESIMFVHGKTTFDRVYRVNCGDSEVADSTELAVIVNVLLLKICKTKYMVDDRSGGVVVASKAYS